MGKTLRLDAKYPNELTKNAKSSKKGKTSKLDGDSKKNDKLSKKGKRVLKGNHLQRTWPFVDEKNKGHHKV